MFPMGLAHTAALVATFVLLTPTVEAVRTDHSALHLDASDTGVGNCDTSLTNLEVMIFNLEGRGGNQGKDDGVARRENLAAWFAKMCAEWTAKTGPHIVMTQEDIAAEIAGCFESIASCESEEWWWKEAEKSPDGNTVKEAEKFGDGTHMRNKIYVHKDLMTSLPWTVSVGTISLDNGGVSNPRCAATATFSMQVPVGDTCKAASFSLASFHLSGGYVDDAEVKRAVEAAAAEPPVTGIRERQLSQISSSLGCSAARCVIGGDTNGFPVSQVSECQSGRLDWMFRDAAAHKQWFKNFLTIPESVGSTSGTAAALTRVQTGGGSDFCGLSEDSSKAATTVWGGQPDQFYTNVAGAGTSVLPAGIAARQRDGGKPFARMLSDHNAVMLRIPLAGLVV